MRIPRYLLVGWLAVLGAGCAARDPGPFSAANAPSCSPPDAPLLIAFGEYEVAPGATDTLHVFSSTRPGAIDPLPDACRPVWTLSADAPATLAPGSGVLRVSPDADDGARFTVSARVADRTASTVVRVVDPARSPLVGTWSQASETACAAPHVESPPEKPIRELRFRRNGRFSVTWIPFESYTDYWGTYTYDPGSGILRLRIEESNFLPEGLDLEGRAEVVGGDVLHLSDLWLGSRTPGAEQTCGTAFHRTGR